MARGLLTYLIVGVGATVLSPVIVPAAVQVGKPLFKGLIKGGILAYHRGREVYAELAESTGDMVAEAVVELATEEETAPVTNVTNLR